jgi:Uma2 family endonuclease
MGTISHKRMAIGDFLAWADGREGRWELIDGVPVAMGPERAIHGLTTHRAANALERAIAKAGRECHVLPDSVVVRIDAHTSYQPDALVYCGERVSDDTLAIDRPIIVIEVLSPGSATKDFRDKLVGYFRVASVQHYLIIDPDRRIVVHHRRGEGDLMQTRIVADGMLSLTPPGLEIAVADLFEATWPE